MDYIRRLKRDYSTDCLKEMQHPLIDVAVIFGQVLLRISICRKSRGRTPMSKDSMIFVLEDHGYNFGTVRSKR